MRSICDLLKDGHKVWFYLRDKTAELQFVQELNHLGARYLNGAPVTLDSCSPIMAVHADRKVAHLMIMIWNASFSPSFSERYMGDATKILRVDYAKYVAGDSDYICQRSEFL